MRKPIVLVLLASFAFSAGAQTPSSSSPETLVTEYLAVLQKDGMSAVSGFMHPDELKEVTFGVSEILGTVREKEMVHVVTRVVAGVKEVRMNKLTVVSTKQFGKEWKLMLSGELEGLATAISSH
jgi:hypothetical protein